MTRATLGSVMSAVAVVSSSDAAAAQHPARNEASPLHVGDTFTVESQVLHESRRINVYAAPGHPPSRDKPLPVLYMPDGGIEEDFLHIAGLLQVLIGNGSMRPFLLVGIENTARRRDLTGPTSDPENRKSAPQVGGSAAFRQFIRAELIPAIESRYPTTKERVIVGESLAGLFVVETFFAEPDLFDTYFAFDPSLWWSKGDLVERAAARIHDAAGRTLYVANSSEGEIALTKRLADVFAVQRSPATKGYFDFLPEETHATLYHPAALRAFRRVLKLETTRQR